MNPEDHNDEFPSVDASSGDMPSPQWRRERDALDGRHETALDNVIQPILGVLEEHGILTHKDGVDLVGKILNRAVALDNVELYKLVADLEAMDGEGEKK